MTREDLIDILPILGAAVLAVCGWFVTYFHRLSFERRKANLDRINRQLRHLYGPLYASLEASSETWSAFSKNYWPQHGQPGYFADGDPTRLTDEEKRRWVTWMKYVFQPLNQQISDLILKNIDLIEGTGMPQSFLDALAHTNAYHAVLAQWEANDFSEYTSVNNWPYQELMTLVKPAFERLRQEQMRMIGERAS